MWRRLMEDARPRRLAVALLVYAAATGVYFALAAKQTITTHTPFNHFALLAESWLQERLDLGGPPPAYAQNNDFASFEGKWYVTFPPFPAILLVPWVKLGGSAINVQDGQFFIWLGGIAPAVLFLVLEKLRRMEIGLRSTFANVVLTVGFAFGTVYFFTVPQGTVWFAAHVVGAALCALYALFAIGAERPVLAGLMLGLGFATRSPLVFAAPLFAFEAVRVSLRASEISAPESVGGRVRHFFGRLDLRALASRLALFSVPALAVLGLMLWHNQARFHDPFEFGYRFLTVAWKGRMEKWGLFSYHYLGRNLAVVLTSLPWVPKPPTDVPFQISHHGLAIWVTSPLYLWLLWPRKKTYLHLALWLSVAAIAVPTLFYQNTGWMQFGYRFSNDYAVLLFCLIAIGGYRMRGLFWLALLWSIAVNSFGAVSFARSKFDKFYHSDPSQRVLHQPD
ncbi:MAG TPA: hypothetical protein PKA88_15655 [Polyangiaceae bacterium]|nr:hypothetical protein [Polyangiaceae bacterium]